MTKANEIIDHSVIELLEQSIGPDRTEVVITEFIELTQKTISETLVFLAEKDFVRFGEGCHKIKSNVAYIGGKELERMCVQVEELCYHKKFNEIEALSEAFKSCCEETLKAIETLTK